jgi:DNA invertase Pin-like site-specific DNA recombinase
MNPNSQAQRVGIYLRVSTVDQETENQLRQLHALCGQQGWAVYKEYVDVESGRKGKLERKEFAKLFKDAAAHRFDLVLFWSLDRFSREGITKTIAYLQQLDACGVKFKSLTEPFLDSGNELVAHILLGVLSYFAQLEATKISTRTKAGLERVRAQGKTLGRPDGLERHGPTLQRLRAEGLSVRRIASETGLSKNSVQSYLNRLKETQAP